MFDRSSSGGIRNFSSIRFAKEVEPGGFSTHPPSAGSGKRTVLTELEFQWLPSVHGPRGADLDRTKSLVSFRLSMSLHAIYVQLSPK